MAESRLPLEGVKCVCIIMFQQLPVAFSMMADLGAEVIKIEPPGTGERGRKMGLFPGLPLSPYFETNNRGFKSLTLNIQKKKGTEILYKLVKDADIFAENFRPGVAERHHFAYEDLEKINPGIIYLCQFSLWTAWAKSPAAGDRWCRPSYRRYRQSLWGKGVSYDDRAACRRRRNQCSGELWRSHGWPVP